jgi:hypothetical protein
LIFEWFWALRLSPSFCRRFSARYLTNGSLWLGEAVKQIQTALAALHYYPDKSAKNFGIDGAYGANTDF